MDPQTGNRSILLRIYLLRRKKKRKLTQPDCLRSLKKDLSRPSFGLCIEQKWKANCVQKMGIRQKPKFPKQQGTAELEDLFVSFRIGLFIPLFWCVYTFSFRDCLYGLVASDMISSSVSVSRVRGFAEETNPFLMASTSP